MKIRDKSASTYSERRSYWWK